MQFNLFSINAIAAAALSISLCVSSTANAIVVYDESNDGDLTDSIGSGTSSLGSLTTGENRVIGTLDGGAQGNPDDGPDEFDTFEFTTTGSWTFSSLSTTGTGFAGYYDSIDAPYSFQGSGNLPGTNLFGTQPAGDYTIFVAPSSNGGTLSYDVSITVTAVPVPAAVWLFGSGLLALLGISRKRRVAV